MEETWLQEIPHAEVLIWMKKASEQTFETLPDFIKEVHTLIPNSYGNGVHRIAIISIATAWAEERECGGITGFQAGAVLWDWLCAWKSDYEPQRLIQYREMLYPQFEYKFRGITQDTFDWMQKKAQEILNEKNDYMVKSVRDHLKTIVNGDVPFGYVITER